MITPTDLEGAMRLQSYLAAKKLYGACAGAGRLVIVELNVPHRTSVAQLAEILKGDGFVPDSVMDLLWSCARRYPDGSLKVDLRFEAPEDATKFLSIARAQMCCP